MRHSLFYENTQLSRGLRTALHRCVVSLERIKLEFMFDSLADDFEIIDISPQISEKTAVFPGDEPFSRQVALDFKKNDHLLLTSFKTSSHIGAHADGANHYHAQGQAIDERDLSFYLGSCQVLRVKLKAGERILNSHIDLSSIRCPRVLFRSDSFSQPETWNNDFNSLSPELIESLAKKGVKLVGIDTPSVDPSDSKLLESHQAIYKNDLAILEGLDLSQVEPGVYTLVALPLKIKGGDASPVRAVLLKAKKGRHD